MQMTETQRLNFAANVRWLSTRASVTFSAIAMAAGFNAGTISVYINPNCKFSPSEKIVKRVAAIFYVNDSSNLLTLSPNEFQERYANAPMPNLSDPLNYARTHGYEKEPPEDKPAKAQKSTRKLQKKSAKPTTPGPEPEDDPEPEPDPQAEQRCIAPHALKAIIENEDLLPAWVLSGILRSNRISDTTLLEMARAWAAQGV